MTLFTPFSDEPDFVNDIGTKWWRDADTTQYAQKFDKNGISLDSVCFFVEDSSGYRTRVLISYTREIIEEDQTLEGMAIKIDTRKFLLHEYKIGPEDNK